MSFYIAIGPRGLIFRAGLLLTGVIGQLSYRRASRRRSAPPAPWAWPEAPLENEAPCNLPDVQPRSLAG